MNTITKKSIAVLLMSATFAAVSVSASAGEPQTPKSIVVNYSDLDVSTKAGAVELKKRIRHAAYDACSATNPFLPLAQKNDTIRPCLKTAVARAIEDVNLAASTSQVRPHARLAAR